MTRRRTAERAGERGRDGAAPPAGAHVPAARRTVVLDVVLILAAAAGLAALAGHGGRYISYDTLRDMASAQALLRGRWGVDPSIPGLPAWYPPGEPVLFAGLARWTGWSVLDLYSTSPYWLGAVVLLALHVLVRTAWSRRIAWTAVATVTLGSCWWMTHIPLPLPGVRGVALGLFSLAAWSRATRDGAGPGWAVASGVLVALAFWVHALCGAMALGSIGVHAVVDVVGSRPGVPRGRRWMSARAASTIGIAVIAAAPVLAHQLLLPRTNAAPHLWFAPELHDPRFALHAHAPLVIPFGLVGLWLAARHWRAHGWLVAYFGLGCAGQLAGYAGHDLGWRLPWLLPHEFQWHGQAALGVAAAVGIGALGVRLPVPRRWGGWDRSAALRTAALAAVVLATAIPVLGLVDDYPTRLDARWTTTLRSAAWIDHNVPEAAVFACAPEVGYILSALTGRRCLVLPPGHMNPAIDAGAREAEVRTLLTTRDPDEFGRIASRLGATHLLLAVPSGRIAAAREAYAGWPDLEAVTIPADSSSLLFRIRSTAAGPASHRATGT